MGVLLVGDPLLGSTGPTPTQISGTLFQTITERASLGLQDVPRGVAARVIADMGGSDGNKRARFIELYLSGVSVAEAARELEVSREYASRVYRRDTVKRMTAEFQAITAAKRVGKA